jgi:NADPH:quinone reductase-like Zn-dependent oxidoreductase
MSCGRSALKKAGATNTADFAESNEVPTSSKSSQPESNLKKTKITSHQNRSIRMRAIIIKEFGGLDSLVIENLPAPEPKPGDVLIEVKAFGINHAETHMRKGEWAEAAKVSGIECVGLVKSCPGGEVQAGTKVAAFMGGLGRTINGSYAEYTCPPATNVIAIKTELPWEDFAVIPESYATAWTCLHRNLQIAKGQTLVIRGATSALGRAAVNIAVDAGAHVIATTRKKQRFEALRELGAHRTEIETPNLSEVIPDRKQIDAVLDLVGNTTFMDSLRMLRTGGRMCLAGWLGGLDPVNNFNPLLQMPSGVHFSFFGSFVFGTPEFPVSDIPLQAIVDKAAAGIYKAKPARVFQFDNIREAHEAMESNQANGKMVVRI